MLAFHPTFLAISSVIVVLIFVLKVKIGPQVVSGAEDATAKVVQIESGKAS